MPETVEHECRQGRRCVGWQRDADGVAHGAGVEEPGRLCGGCEAAAFDSIRRLDDDYLMLAGERGVPRSAATAGAVAGSRTYPVPIRLDVDAVMTAIVTESMRWARLVTRGDIDFPASSRGCVYVALAAITSRLGTLVDQPAREITTLVPHPDGGDYLQREVCDGVDAVLRLARLHERAEAALGTREARIWLPDACHVCGRKALTASKDQEWITCQGCRNVWDKNHFANLNNPMMEGKAEA